MRRMARTAAVHALLFFGSFAVVTVVMYLLHVNDLPTPSLPDWVWGL